MYPKKPANIWYALLPLSALAKCLAHVLQEHSVCNILLLDLTVQISDLCKCTEVRLRQMCLKQDSAIKPLKAREPFGDVDYRLHN